MSAATPIMTLFREFEAKYRQAGDMSFDEEVANGLLDECSSLEKRVMANPSTSAQDFAAKLIVNTRYGDFMLDDAGEGGLLDEALAILAVREHPDAKLIDLGKQFERAKAEALPLDAERMRLHAIFEAAAEAAGISADDGKAARKLMRECGYRAASDTFIAKHGEAIKLMKAIHRTRATTLEGVAVKLEAVTFDLYYFELDPKGGDVAEIQLLRLCKQTRELVKQGGQRNG